MIRISRLKKPLVIPPADSVIFPDSQARKFITEKPLTEHGIRVLKYLVIYLKKPEKSLKHLNCCYQSFLSLFAG